MKTVLTLILITLLNLGSFAHAVWIETGSEAKAGMPQQVKVYYGEYGEGEIEPMEKWYSDLKDLTIWCIGPDNEKTALKGEAKTDHLLASFTPTRSGIYTIMISHTTADFPKTTRYQFNTAAVVKVGKVTGNEPVNFQTPIKVIPSALWNIPNQNLQLTARLDGQPAQKFKVTITTPDGWTKQVHTNDDGMVDLQLLGKGRYMIEASDVLKEQGQQNEKEYQATWRNFTFIVEVKK